MRKSLVDRAQWAMRASAANLALVKALSVVSAPRCCALKTSGSARPSTR
jgi:hypothetical protein